MRYENTSDVPFSDISKKFYCTTVENEYFDEDCYSYGWESPIFDSLEELREWEQEYEKDNPYCSFMWTEVYDPKTEKWETM